MNFFHKIQNFRQISDLFSQIIEIIDLIEKATHVTIFWNLARNPEKKFIKNSQKKNAKFELFAIELMNID